MKSSMVVIGTFLILVLVLSGCAQQQTKYVCSDGATVFDASDCPKQGSGQYCGDGICNNNENCESCSSDCGRCPSDYPKISIKAYADSWKDVSLYLPAESDSGKTLMLERIDEPNYYGIPDPNFIGKRNTLQFILYSEATLQEGVSCEVKEYYDGAYHSKFTTEINTIIVSTNKKQMSYPTSELRFENDIKPKMVRYDYTCEGGESGNTYSNSYFINLEYSN